jgi:hypothetical protein
VALDERWSLWRWAALRGAGFPIAPLLDLAAPPCAAAADRLLQTGTGRADYEAAFEAAAAQTSRTLRRHAADDTLREAVTWQNRTTVHNSLDRLLADGPRTSRDRKAETEVASYLQRYCAKNDTIGFFGPVGWARLRDTGPALAVRPGDGLLTDRTTYFEGWCIDRLAEAIAASVDLRRWLAPRLLPALHVEGTTLHVPLGRPVPLPAREAALLVACDGTATPIDIAGRLGMTEDEVLSALDTLRRTRRIAWTLELPADDLYPEQALRQRLALIPDEPMSAKALASLTELERSRQEVAAAAGQPARLDRALHDMETAFTRLTGAEPYRLAGRAYAGRTIVYEDSRRDIEVDLGPRLLADLGPSLGLILDGARWFVHRASQLYRAAFTGIHTRLAERRGGNTVPFADFWLYAYPLLFGDEPEPLATLKRETAQAWRAVLGPLDGSSRKVYASADLRPLADQVFAVADPDWRGVRHYCPDVMIAATGPQEIEDGDYQAVLGEIHSGMNTLAAGVFWGQHPVPGELLEAMDRDLGGPRVAPVFSRAPGGVTPRTSRALVRDHDFRFVFAEDSCGIPPERALTTGSLVVEQVDGRLEVASRDGRCRFDVMELLGELMMLRAHRGFDLVPDADHTPRIVFDRLVVARERWRVPATELDLAAIRENSARYLAARRFMRSHRMPRFVFTRSGERTKPIYTDFDSPASIAVLTKMLRRKASVTITVAEMLPDPARVWLPDSRGQRYSSELRIVAVDTLSRNR